MAAGARWALLELLTSTFGVDEGTDPALQLRLLVNVADSPDALGMYTSQLNMRPFAWRGLPVVPSRLRPRVYLQASVIGVVAALRRRLCGPRALPDGVRILSRLEEGPSGYRQIQAADVLAATAVVTLPPPSLPLSRGRVPRAAALAATAAASLVAIDEAAQDGRRAPATQCVQPAQS